MKTRACFLALCLTLFACSLFSPAPTPTQTDILNSTKPNPLANTIPETTIVPTPTWEEILVNSSGGGMRPPAPVAGSDFPPPSVNPVIPLPPSRRCYPSPQGTINMLLLGSDAHGPFGGQRTDTLLFVSFHPKRGEVTIISFPAICTCTFRVGRCDASTRRINTVDLRRWRIRSTTTLGYTPIILSWLILTRLKRWWIVWGGLMCR